MFNNIAAPDTQVMLFSGAVSESFAKFIDPVDHGGQFQECNLAREEFQSAAGVDDHPLGGDVAKEWFQAEEDFVPIFDFCVPGVLLS